jgi:hypothetical protein
LAVIISVIAMAHRTAPPSLPAKNAFFLLCKSLHKRNYVQHFVMHSSLAHCVLNAISRRRLAHTARSELHII